MNRNGKVAKGKMFIYILAGVCMGLVISGAFDFTGTSEGWWGRKEPALETGEGKTGAPSSEEAKKRTPVEPGKICLPDFSELAEQIDPSVVNISTMQTVKGSDMLRGFRFHGPGQQFGPKGRDPFEEFFEHFGVPRQGMKRRSLGSGFVIDKEGYILTNNHVIREADSITVVFVDESEAEAKVIGKDPKTDLALIKVDMDRDLPVAPLGDSDTLKVGDWVLAIGNPFGLKFTLTAGIVSAKGREIGAGPYDDFIQTDASINPGNSGGPLLNMKGEVVGINSAIIAGGTGIGFAIPVNMARELLPQLKEKGHVSRGWLGVYIQKITPELAKTFGLKEPMGALVSEVTKDGPADGSGLKHGDVIIEFQGQPVESYNDLPRMVAGIPPGTKAEIKVLRKGKTKTFDIKLGELPEGDKIMAEPESGEELGLELQEITPDLARTHDLPADSGLIVTNVLPEGGAAEAGIRRGDIIQEVDQEPIRSLDDFRKIVKKTDKGDNMLFLIKRREGALYITVEKK